MNKKELQEFSEEVRVRFEKAEIGGPVHLSGNNEEQLIEIFKKIKPTDWIFSTHRSHYHALLHGIRKKWLMNEILNKRSISIENIEHKFVTSAIVGGILPIALGTALAIKKKGDVDTHVWAFIGDMAALSGVFHEVNQYASRHKLPLSIVIEDNGYSTCSPTQKVWGTESHQIVVYRYSYNRIYPHQGTGKWIEF